MQHRLDSTCLQQHLLISQMVVFVVLLQRSQFDGQCVEAFHGFAAVRIKQVSLDFRCKLEKVFGFTWLSPHPLMELRMNRALNDKDIFMQICQIGTIRFIKKVMSIQWQGITPCSSLAGYLARVVCSTLSTRYSSINSLRCCIKTCLLYTSPSPRDS